MYLKENEIKLFGRVRKYDPKTGIEEETEKTVTMKLKKILENKKPQDLLHA